MSDDLGTRIKEAKERYESANPVKEPTQYNREMSLGIRAFMEILGVMLGSGLMGWALDDYFGTSPTILIIFVILGIGAAFFNLYKLSRNLGTAIGSNNLQSGQETARKPSQNESDLDD